MKKFYQNPTARIFLIFTLVFFLKMASGSAESALGSKDVKEPLYHKIEQLTGCAGVIAKGKVFKVSSPRSDLEVNVLGVRLSPLAGLSSWAAFKPMGGQMMVMGDLVLLDDQVNPVMSVALDNGLEVTALHNHFLWDSPNVMFMHIAGHGDIEELASAVGKVFAKIKEPGVGEEYRRPYARIDAAMTTLDPRKIEEILGAKGLMTDGVYKITIGRTTTMDGEEIGDAMGVNTWAAFIGSDEQAVVDGDIAMLETELQGVLKALRAKGIYVLAIHNHMTMESPRIIFLHYWGVGSTVNLAKGLKAALDAQQKESDSREMKK